MTTAQPKGTDAGVGLARRYGPTVTTGLFVAGTVGVLISPWVTTALFVLGALVGACTFPARHR